MRRRACSELLDDPLGDRRRELLEAADLVQPCERASGPRSSGAAFLADAYNDPPTSMAALTVVSKTKQRGN